MTPPLNTIPCPDCNEGPGTLAIEVRPVLEARPLGTWSLAGDQLKTSAVERDRPVLVCRRCTFRHIGDFDTDGRHATFPPLPLPENPA